MTSLTECRLLIDPPAPGAWNMAVDEMLLEWAAEQDGCCWRFYGWREPTLSLGYFQPHEDRRQHLPSRNCPTVRRLTGGGAIVHDAELTYSLVLPSRHPLALRRDLLYESIHSSLIDVLADFGTKAVLCEPPIRHPGREQPFLCFKRRAPGDVLVDGTKVAGSAQRRRRGAVLQHGSVPLRPSAAAPELPALEDVLGTTIRREQLAEAWLAKLSSRLAITWRQQTISAGQRCRAESLAQKRYALACWTQHRQCQDPHVLRS
jgi:lipoate-protein ligase A